MELPRIWFTIARVRGKRGATIFSRSVSGTAPRFCSFESMVMKPLPEVANLRRTEFPGRCNSLCCRKMAQHSVRILILLGILVSSWPVAGAIAAVTRVPNAMRGLTAVRAEHGIFLSWRLLEEDPPGISFNIFRRNGIGTIRQVNQQPLTAGTCFLDTTATPDQPCSYWIVQANPGWPIATKVDQLPAQCDYQPTLGNYLSIPTRLPEGYHANDASVGDLDGDGRADLVVHIAGRGRDCSQAGLTDPPIFHAYRLDGTLLWKIELGINCREGAHYNPFLVYDLDGDGRAEFVCRTADGTRDGLGQVIGNEAKDWRDLEPTIPQGRSGRRRNPRFGKVLAGPEYLSVFDGQTGRVLTSVPYIPARSPENPSPDPATQKRIWGDDYGNRMDRFLAGIAYLDGHSPSVVFSRGYYTRTVIAAFDFKNQNLVTRWVFDSDLHGPRSVDNPWRGQGNHSLCVADVDNDGRDEILYGGMTIDDDGTGLYSTGLGHGDAQHTSDLDPERPGLETWSIHENERPGREFIGSELRDAATGELLFAGRRGRDVARGMAADIDPRSPGYELWGGLRTLLSCKGKPIGRPPRSTNMAIWWDGDLLRELADGVTITKWDWEQEREVTLLAGSELGLAANNGTKNNPCLIADLLGDWREELVARTRDNREIRIYLTTSTTEHRFPCLLEDRQYRLSVVWQNVGYNQPAHPSFYLGAPPATITSGATHEQPASKRP